MNYEIIGSSSKGNCMEEVWKPIEDFKDKYEISNLGRIRNIRTNHILKMTNQYGDYFSIILYNETHKRTTRIHREVAKAFVPNPNNLPCVNHKDMNKQNNNVNNLEWCTYSYNTRDAINKGANTMSGFNRYNKNKFHEKYGKLFQCDKEKNILNEFYDLDEANKTTGICKRNILQVINHQEGRTQAGGYIWISEKEMMNNEI